MMSPTPIITGVFREERDILLVVLFFCLSGGIGVFTSRIQRYIVPNKTEMTRIVRVVVVPHAT